MWLFSNEDSSNHQLEKSTLKSEYAEIVFRLTGMKIATICKPVLSALVDLHGLNIVPGNVKTESVLLSSTSWGK